MSDWLSKIKSTFRSHCVARGEKFIAGLGVAAAAILIGAMGANGWWVLNMQKESATTQQVEKVRTIGVVLSRSAEVMLADDQLTSLRQLVINSARDFHLNRCRILIGPDQIIADANPTKINMPTLPAKWNSGPLDAGQMERAAGDDQSIQLRFPLDIHQRGIAFLEIGGISSDPWAAVWRTQTGINLIGAAGLAILLIAYRRHRGSMVAQEAVDDALSSFSVSPEDTASLTLDATLGPLAVNWNKLLASMDDLRRQNAMARANSTGGRRANVTGLESACDAMSQGLLLVDERMRIRFANGAASVFLKAKRESLVGAAIEELIAEERLRQAIRAIACDKSRRPMTLEIERPSDAGGGVLRFSVRPVRKGDPQAATIIIEDVTQQRTAERARNSFITQVTHELRTPLTNIRLYAETAIEQRDADPKAYSNCLNVINQESRRLERIVGEMLSVAEMEAGACTIRKDDVHIDILFNELTADYKAQAAEHNIQLEFVLPPKLPVVQADRDKIAIALHNLLGNALKYTPDGGKVTVIADVRDGNITVDVADSGIGIAPDELESIFDRFTRSKDPRVGKVVGTGLGLTLAREVMRLHGGDVTVQSELNRGSTFTAILPVSAEAA
ncbi:MAG: ATP-binding protein [Planctomycetota bacterium]|nr:ATP-binding protein [Planctomycetota bacterium]